MKRILIGYVIGNNSCGIDTYLFGIIRALQKEEYAFDLLTTEEDDFLKTFCEETGCRLFEVPSLKHPVNRYQTIKSIVKDTTYDAAYFNISEAFNCIDALMAMHFKVKRVIVHSHSSGTNETSAVKRCVRVAIHSFCRKFVIGKAATDFFACSGKAAEWMYPKKLRESKGVKLISNAVEREKYEFNPEVRAKMRRELGVEHNFVFGHISGFTEQKNIGFLIDIVNEARKLDNSVKLLLIGDGREADTIREKVHMLKLEEHVSFLGRRDDISNLLQAMDAFVFPSLFEGLPFALVEAQMAGLMVYPSDAITVEAKLSEKCIYIGLDQTAEEWARQELSRKEYDREHTVFTNESFDMKKQKEEFLKIF